MSYFDDGMPLLHPANDMRGDISQAVQDVAKVTGVATETLTEPRSFVGTGTQSGVPSTVTVEYPLFDVGGEKYPGIRVSVESPDPGDAIPAHIHVRRNISVDPNNPDWVEAHLDAYYWGTEVDLQGPGGTSVGGAHIANDDSWMKVDINGNIAQIHVTDDGAGNRTVELSASADNGAVAKLRLINTSLEALLIMTSADGTQYKLVAPNGGGAPTFVPYVP